MTAPGTHEKESPVMPPSTRRPEYGMTAPGTHEKESPVMPPSSHARPA
jgi:hypothetical protein